MLASTSKFSSSPHLHASGSTARIMRLVLLACIPAFLASTWFFGIGLAINLLIASSTAIALEAIISLMRGRAVALYLRDTSIVVTAVLLCFAIPPGAPWWIPFIGSVFAVVIGKHVYGGLGNNLFNPAMVAYVMLLISFPLEMTGWYVPDAARLAADRADPLSIQGMFISLQISMPWLSRLSLTDYKPVADGFAMATPLIEYKFAAPNAIYRTLNATGELQVSLFDRAARTGWEWINLSFLAGGLFLLYKRIITWHIPAAILISVSSLAWYFYQPGSEAIHGSPWQHLFISATMIGAFFIATDPVSSPASHAGKLIYGVIIGISIYCIRIWGSYLDSVGFAVLLGNIATPLIDHCVRSRVYGTVRFRFLRGRI
jgi:Na+-translocating ferredoxin:NAD+ oxidoreductase subunit D